MTLEYEWSEELSDTSTTEYSNFSRDVTDFLINNLKESFGADFLSVKISNFRQGSVVFDLTAYFKASTNATAHMLTEVMKARKADSTFNIIEIELKQSYPCIQVCATTNQPKSETWIFKYVSIAFGVVITVLLVIILLLVVSRLLWLSIADQVLAASLQKFYSSHPEMSHAINSNFLMVIKFCHFKCLTRLIVESREKVHVTENLPSRIHRSRRKTE